MYNIVMWSVDLFFNHQMESSVCQFDAELLLLRHQKLRLDWQLKMADLRQLTLHQELLLFKEFEIREESLQEKLDGHIEEEIRITVGESICTCWLWCKLLYVLFHYSYYLVLQKKII